jgi:hypothetical protein
MVRMRRHVPAGAQASQEPITVRRAISDALGFVIDLAIAGSSEIRVGELAGGQDHP